MITERAQKGFAEVLAPKLTTRGLKALLKALEDDSPDLVQGRTTNDGRGDDSPPDSAAAVTCACAAAYTIWKSDTGLYTVLAVRTRFNQILSDLREKAGEGFSAVSAFIDWFDRTPRSRMRAALTPIVREIVEARRAALCSGA